MNDTKLLIAITLALFCILLIVFYKEPVISVIQLTTSIAAISYIPGYYLTKKIFDTPAERLLYGSATSLAIIGGSAYYLGLLGFSLSITSYALPLILIIIGIVVSR